MASRLDGAADDLVPLAVRETHLGAQRLQGELKRTTFQLRLFGEVLARRLLLESDRRPGRPGLADGPAAGPPPDAAADRTGGGRTRQATSRSRSASPAATPPPALAAGCPVMVKAHPGHPRLSERRPGHQVVDALGRGGCAGRRSSWSSLGHDIGIALVRTRGSAPPPSPAHSAAGGRFSTSPSRRPDPIPFYGEFGSVNPAFVTPERSPSGRMTSPPVSSTRRRSAKGQFCTKPGLLFVPAGTRPRGRDRRARRGASGGADAQRAHSVRLLRGAGKLADGPASG